MRLLRVLGALLVCTVLTGSAAGAGAATAAGSGSADRARAAALPPYERIVPAPARTAPGGPGYRLGTGTVIRTTAGSAAARGVGELLAAALRPETGLPLKVAGTDAPGAGDGIRLRLDPAAGAYGEEGYRLAADEDGVVVTAHRPAGLFRGTQTLRQLLPAGGPAEVAGGTVADTPRFGYRGAMIDLARHYFSPAQVRRFVDQLALYKINVLHLHLTDDQGWRLAVDSWPRLAAYGGASEVGGGPGGHWTKADYRELVRYAGERYLEVVPEIDMPGHVNAALASYPELNCSGVAPARYTGTKVGFSSLCVAKERTYEFVADVLREVAELTPGRYLHIGGDEAYSTPHADYAAFMARAQQLVAAQGKTVLAWHQLAGAKPAPGAVLQYWGHDKTSAADKAQLAEAVRGGTKVILSPADRTYLDMKYDAQTGPGMSWAGYVPVRRSYEWDPGRYLPGVDESAVAGVEAALWTEKVATTADADLMAFPRLISTAELGWSPASSLSWDTYRLRLATQAPRLKSLGVGYYRSAEVPWL
ncbi:beta-N-acetylhexosaminidase [Streptomyces sp. NPDC089919]|uniref:beta-N-acetylhexosaminidase n=1 Tax=Streptomyces sp. NPDC089919 TaxID=3155188 RepID=UPI0034415636